jgi:cystathionine beta-lyase/cystathionine gamma-synthase
MKLQTHLLHPDKCIQDPYKASSTPIYQTATFKQNDASGQDFYDYSRSDNPTRNHLERCLADIENAQYALAFNSGMAAIANVCTLLQPGDELLANMDLYGGTYRFFHEILLQQQVQLRFFDPEKETIDQHLNEKTRMVWIETPSNPLMQIINISQIAQNLRSSRAIFVVDNSLVSSWLQKPLNHGADIVIQSATKHLSGHSDVTGGVVTTNSSEYAKVLKFRQNAAGSALAPFESWLLLRGLQTLPIRIDKQQQNAYQIADYLSKHPLIHATYFPGLNDNQALAIHNQQAFGSGTVITIDPGNVEAAQTIVNQTRLFNICVSFGSIISSILMPVAMSHIPAAENSSHLKPSLVRISAGIENEEDLINDLAQAIEQAFAG